MFIVRTVNPDHAFSKHDLRRTALCGKGIVRDADVLGPTLAIGVNRRAGKMFRVFFVAAVLQTFQRQPGFVCGVVQNLLPERGHRQVFIRRSDDVVLDLVLELPFADFPGSAVLFCDLDGH